MKVHTNSIDRNMAVPEFKIGNRKIGGDNPVFVIAELSGNHHQNYEEAVKLVKAAKKAGADAVKLQTYTPDTITINCKNKWFISGNKENPGDWLGKSLYELYQTAYTPWEWQSKLKKLADELGIILFSTPFDVTAVDFLERMNVPCYKVASYEVTDIPLLKKIASTGKPVIMSIGMATLGEVEFALEILRKHGAKDIAVLHCVTAYADEPVLANMNLETIADIRKRFGVVSGFSDNNGGIEVPIMSAKSGASIVEKHLILDKTAGGVDSRFSIDPQELAVLVREVRKELMVDESRFKQALGKIHYGPVGKTEEYNRNFRKSLFVVKDIKKGDRFSTVNVRSIRPGFGLHTKYFDEIIGKTASVDIEFGTPLRKEHIVGNII